MIWFYSEKYFCLLDSTLSALHNLFFSNFGFEPIFEAKN